MPHVPEALPGIRNALVQSLLFPTGCPACPRSLERIAYFLEKTVKFAKSAWLGGLFLASMASLALAQGGSKAPIKIGEINSYSTIPQFTQPYRQGWQLAMVCCFIQSAQASLLTSSQMRLPRAPG